MQAKAAILFAGLAVMSLAYLWWRRREGRLRRTGDSEDRLTRADLGTTRGWRATLVQFSTDTCARCGPAAALLRRVAESAPGVQHIEIDAAARLDLARRFNILRTPTVLVLNDEGRVVGRMSGVLSEAHVRDALELASPPPEYLI